jgi:hypothetical protein
MRRVIPYDNCTVLIYKRPIYKGVSLVRCGIHISIYGEALQQV